MNLEPRNDDKGRERREERTELLKNDKKELIKNIGRNKRKLRGALDSIDALWPDEGSTDKERRIKEDMIKKPIRSALFVLNVCWQIFIDGQQINGKTEEVKKE